MSWGRSGRGGAVALALALAVLVGACSSGPAPSDAGGPGGPAPNGTTPGITEPDVGATPAPAGSPLGWEPCGSVECATLRVPVDHDRPAGPTVDLRLARRPATDPDRRIGTLLVHPGGPGASGTSAVTWRALAPLGERFDLVGWDQRGVGGSGALGCGDEVAQLWAADSSDPRARSDLDALAQRLARSCAHAAGPLLDHMGTVAAARDLELVRQALGEDTLSYLGFSYGTLLGQEYARLHPGHLRAMVLDGVIDPTEDLAELLRGQAIAIEATLGDLTARYDRVITAARTQALRAAGGDLVGPGTVALAAVAASYPAGGHALLAEALAEAEGGDGTGLARLAASYGASGVDFGAYLGVTCTDSPRPQDRDAWWTMADELAATAPRLGHPIATELLPCAWWPSPPGRPLAPVDPPGLAPVLVVGTTGDGATPYDDAVAVAEQLPGAVLLTVDRAGHTAFTGSACAQEHTSRYLFELTLPAPGTVCPG